MNPVPISLVILTYNEEKNIRDCVASAEGFDEVNLLDSGSTDQTIQIAQQAGANIFTHPFTGFGQQRNWAIHNIPSKYDWQFHLDADERLTPDLIAEMSRRISSNCTAGGFLIPSKLIFMGKWLKRSGCYPTYQVRLFHRNRLRFSDHGHGQREVSNYPIQRLDQPYLHLAFSKGLDNWFTKHVTYARKEAEHAIHEMSDASDWMDLFCRDSTRRRRALKRLSHRLPCRYVLRFLYLFILKRGFLDGSAGFTYCQMISTYEGMMEVYLRMLQSGKNP